MHPGVRVISFLAWIVLISYVETWRKGQLKNITNIGHFLGLLSIVSVVIQVKWFIQDFALHLANL